MAQIVETVTGTNMSALRAARDRATDADLVELRLDGVADVDVAGALEGRQHPVIVTCRPTWEGGRFDGSEEERLRVLGRAIELGAEFVDVEWRADRRRLPTGERTRMVLSFHDFSGVPADLADHIRAMRTCGAAIVKVAVTANHLRDCLTLKDAARGDGEYVAIAMGNAGQLTRVWPAWFGSCWTYGGQAAPGQLPARTLRDVFHVARTTTASRVFGIGGAPLGHSASPAMHNAAFAHLGADAVFVPLETADAREFLDVAEAIGLAGASVTAPLKAPLQALAKPDDELAARLGAINTLRKGRRGWEARNFDVAGFLTPLDRRSIELRDRRAVVLGAGGAARAVVWALVSHGADVRISGRDAARARALAAEFGAAAGDWPPEPGWQVLVNTTPVGTSPHAEESPLDRRCLSHAAGTLVYDLVYNPPETTLLRWARESGADVIGGLEMLVSQACRQFEWWMGKSAPRDVIAAAARAFVGAHEANVV